MQKYKQAAISIAFLTLIISAGLCTGGVSKDDVDSDRDLAQQEAILATFEDGDYDEWRRIVGQEARIDRVISEEDFKKFVEARNAARSTDYDKAIAIGEELEGRLKEKLADQYFS